MESHSKFKLSAIERVIEIEGSEVFVSKQIEDLKDLIVQFASVHTSNTRSDPFSAEVEATNETASAAKLSDSEQKTAIISNAPAASLFLYPNTYAEMNGVLKIVVDIPGSSMKEKMRNCALIFGYGRQLCGNELFASEEVRIACKDHGILDPKNFAKTFDDKTTFVVEGKGVKKSIKLSHTGNKSAKALVEGIESNAG